MNHISTHPSSIEASNPPKIGYTLMHFMDKTIVTYLRSGLTANLFVFCFALMFV